MGNTLKVVKQTHKTILFENFNNWQTNSLNLATVLKTDQQDSSKQLESLHKLEVHSFDEFVDKFVPKIYEKVEKTPACSGCGTDHLPADGNTGTGSKQRLTASRRSRTAVCETGDLGG